MAITEEKGKYKKNSAREVWISLASGVGGGVICSLICAPLDVAKVRLQIQGSLRVKKYTGGITSTLTSIYREEGIRGTFRGLGPTLFTVPIFWGTYWPIYNQSKRYIIQNYPDISIPLAHLSAAIISGVIGDIITNPFWVTRTRIQTLALHPESKLYNTKVGTLGMMKTIYREEGFFAFYKGLSASILGLTHVAIQFPLCKCCH